MYRTDAVVLLGFKTSVECRARLWIVANAPVPHFHTSTLSTSFYVTSYVDQKFKVEAIQGEVMSSNRIGVSGLEYALP